MKFCVNLIKFTEKCVKLTKFLKWHWFFSLGRWHWFLAISKFSLGKKVNAKKMISRKKVFCTKKFFPLVYLVNHVEIRFAKENGESTYLITSHFIHKSWQWWSRSRSQSSFWKSPYNQPRLTSQSVESKRQFTDHQNHYRFWRFHSGQTCYLSQTKQHYRCAFQTHWNQRSKIG